MLAGAGSGKTRVITFRIARLIQLGIKPENILAVTFTNKAAAEMKERVAELIDISLATKVTISTFHALGARILREDIEKLGYKTPFSILDPGDQQRILQDVLKDLRLGGSKKLSRLLQIVSKAKNAMTSPAKLPEARYNPEMPSAQRIFVLYGEMLRALNAVDFDDLLLLTTRLLEDFPETRTKYHARYRFIMVDEYQDTNPIQMRMLRALVKVPDNNIVVVGDDDQSIYGFRGAVASNILRFSDSFSGAKTIALEQNYRSKSTILNAANAVIANNAVRHKKTLWSDLGKGKYILSIPLKTSALEAQFIADQIVKRQKFGRKWKDFAILYRTNPQARLLEENLRNFRVPYRILGGKSVFDRKEIRDFLAYLRLLVHWEDEISIRRIVNYPARGLGARSVSMLHKHAQNSKTPFIRALKQHENLSLTTQAQSGIKQLLSLLNRYRSELRTLEVDQISSFLRRYIKEIRLKEAILAGEKNGNIARVRWKNVKTMLVSVARVKEETAFKSLAEFVERVSLNHTNTKKEEENNLVTLMTLHASKGLEFPVVFISGMSEGLLPHKNAIKSNDLNEERRLCYVGMTRAKEELIFTRAQFTISRNRKFLRKPSRFIKEIPLEYIREKSAIKIAHDPQKMKQEREKRDRKFEEMKKMLRETPKGSA